MIYSHAIVFLISGGLIKIKQVLCTWISYFIDEEIEAQSVRQSFLKAPRLVSRGTETQTQDSCFHHSIKRIV